MIKFERKTNGYFRLDPACFRLFIKILGSRLIYIICTMKNLAFVGFCLLIISCGKPIPDLSPIDLNQWKADKGGCAQMRSRFLTELQNQKEELKGLSEKDIIRLLGRPDLNELYKRNQKFYRYDLTPGKSCASSLASGQQLIIRFTAMGYAKEVSIESTE